MRTSNFQVESSTSSSNTQIITFDKKTNLIKGAGCAVQTQQDRHLQHVNTLLFAILIEL